MMWSYRHDLQLCREIAFQNPFKFKFGSRERGQCWDSIADVLNDAEQPGFNVDQRGVRERYSKLEKNFKKRMASEERASGIIGEDISELDQAIETILGLIEAADLESVKSIEKKKKELEREKETAESVRKRSMERLGETMCREKGRENEGKRRKVGGETVVYLKKKGEMENELRREEIGLRRKEIELRSKELEFNRERECHEQELRNVERRERESREKLIIQQQQQIMMLIEQQKQQQEQQQQVINMMQQQSSVILTIISKMNEK